MKFEKIGKYALLAVVWGIVLGYVTYSVSVTRRHRSEQVVESVDIEIVDSTANGHLVSSRKVREWILRSGISTIGVPVGKVDLAGIEAVIARNGFVDRVNTYVSYTGVLHIEVSQRRPMLRLMMDGYNSYTTDKGFVFKAPSASALYVPVVTGSYKPPFPADYEGDVWEYIEKRLAESDERIRKIGREKLPLYELEDSLTVAIRNERRRYIKKRWFESKESFQKKVDELRAEKHRNLRKLRGALRDANRRVEAVTARQQAEYQAQKKLNKRYEDFIKLINFVCWIEDDDFWRSEVVQIVARTMPSGALEVDLVPRSGNYTILFGEIDDIEGKFDKLMRFYRDGLNNIGWDEYSSINIKYEGQVVCRK